MVKLKRKTKSEQKTDVPKIASTINKTEAENSQLELFTIKQNIKVLTERESSLKKRLGEYMEKSIKPDGKGHFLFTTVNEKGEKIHLQRQARKKVSLVESKAFEIVNSLGLKDKIIPTVQVIAPEVTNDQVLEVLEKHAPHLLTTSEKVDEKALEQSVLNGEITMEQFEEMCNVSITYAMTYIDDSKLQDTEN